MSTKRVQMLTSFVTGEKSVNPGEFCELDDGVADRYILSGQAVHAPLPPPEKTKDQEQTGGDDGAGDEQDQDGDEGDEPAGEASVSEGRPPEQPASSPTAGGPSPIVKPISPKGKGRKGKG